MPIWANCIAVAFVADESAPGTVAELVGDAAAPLLGATSMAFVVADGEVVAGDVALSVAIPSVRASKILTPDAARRRTDETPGNVTMAFSVVHVMAFAANADESAAASRGIMYCPRAAEIRPGICVPMEALAPATRIVVQDALDSVLHWGPVKPFVQTQPQL